VAHVQYVGAQPRQKCRSVLALSRLHHFVVVVAGDSSVNVSSPLTVGWQSGSRAAARQWPVRWDAGQWSGTDCAVNQSVGNLSVAYCRAAGSFALLQVSGVFSLVFFLRNFLAFFIPVRHFRKLKCLVL